jgi:DNA-binding LacI/PurR family transcriptional regulator
MNEAGRAIPDDLSVVGFDNIPEAPFFTPPLTTVRQDFDEMGARGLACLLEAIEGGQPAASRSRVRPQLIVRGSTGPAPT